MLKDDLKKLYKVACDDAVACFREIAEYDGDALVFEDGLKLAKDTFEQKIRELCPLKKFMSEGAFMIWSSTDGRTTASTSESAAARSPWS